MQALATIGVYGFSAEAFIQALRDAGALVEGLPPDRLSALLCVERDPEACHRSLIARRLEAEHDVRVTHLRPGSS